LCLFFFLLCFVFLTAFFVTASRCRWLLYDFKPLILRTKLETFPLSSFPLESFPLASIAYAWLVAIPLPGQKVRLEI
jgi:hypothetical protein